jgi:hypothetical protein
MNPSNNYNYNTEESDNSNEDIRPPDEVYTDRLIPDTYADGNSNNYDDDLNEAIYNSLKSYKELTDKCEIDTEKKLFELFETEKLHRKRELEPILQKMKKLIKYDVEANDVYIIIDPIMDAYMHLHIDYIAIDYALYERIFDFLNKIRLTNNEKDIFERIIRRDNVV